ncbi:MAG: HAD-IIIA family hydrolase [Candidatus Zixiibacteriota bacterium]
MAAQILVIRFGSLGDIILTSPTVLNLRIRYPNAHLTYLTRSRFRAVVELFEGVDEIVTLDDPGGIADLARLIHKLSHRNFDLVVDLHGNMRSWLSRKLLDSSVVVQYPKRRFERQLIIRRHRFPDGAVHTIDMYNDCLKQIGAIAPAFRPVVRSAGGVTMPIPKWRGWDCGRAIVIAPGAAHPNKQWPVKRFAELAGQLIDQHGVSIVWAVTDVDAGRSDLIGNLAADRFTELVSCPLDQLATIIERASLTIANDSGIAHLSSSVGTPVLSLFGPTHPSLGFWPRGMHDRVIDVDEHCRPCSLHGKRSCYREQRFCLDRISVEMVLDAAKKTLGETSDLFPALFVDRDGTISEEKDFLSNPEDLQLMQGTVQALKLANRQGYKIIVITNQSGVARGLFGINSVEQVNARLMEILDNEGVAIDGIYYCPHHPAGKIRKYSCECGCRKPAAGMAEEACNQLGIDLRRSFVVGDKLDDYFFGHIIGAKSYLVRTGHGGRIVEKYGNTLADGTIRSNLLDAVEYHITNQQNRSLL